MGERADIVLRGGRVFDGVALLPDATAVAVVDGRIAAVGTDAEVTGRFTPGRTIELDGGMIGPGFTDAHNHAAFAGYEMITCDVSAVTTRRGYREVIARYAQADLDGWITGAGWSMAHFPGGTPTRQELDAIVRDRPVFLINRDHHGAWANTRALELAGLHAGTQDPHDGRIEREPDGFPAGTLHEGAMDLVSRLVPPPTAEKLVVGLESAAGHLTGLGVTGWQEAIVGEYAGYPDVAAAYGQAIGKGRLKARACGALWLPRDAADADPRALIDGFSDRRKANAALGFRTDTIKLMVDGVAENQTAAVEEPYLVPCRCHGAVPGQSGWEPGTGTGLAYLAPEFLDRIVPLLDTAGFNLHFHTIGDRAARIALDALEGILPSATGESRRRHHIAHLQILNPRDIARFARLSVTANLQALWACNDAQMTELTLPQLGDQRAGWQYPFASLAAAGAELAMGSDWSVSSPDPWQAIHVAVNRTPPGKPDTPPLLPDQMLDLTTALSAYTSGSARLLHMNAGRLVPGAPADVAVASGNPFELPREDLWTISNVATLVGGEFVHGG
ncbi:MAG: amidohydrolase [Arthrobacter sp.]|uniref:amidohydrolase n=1 Tax=Arthrobacter sp. TaxID=1667 RepID=UPI00347A153A